MHWLDQTSSPSLTPTWEAIVHGVDVGQFRDEPPKSSQNYFWTCKLRQACWILEANNVSRQIENVSNGDAFRWCAASARRVLWLHCIDSMDISHPR